jgi:hypothetical protein
MRSAAYVSANTNLPSREKTLTGVRCVRPDRRPIWVTAPNPGRCGAIGAVSRFVTCLLKHLRTGDDEQKLQATVRSFQSLLGWNACGQTRQRRYGFCLRACDSQDVSSVRQRESAIRIG